MNSKTKASGWAGCIRKTEEKKNFSFIFSIKVSQIFFHYEESVFFSSVLYWFCFFAGDDEYLLEFPPKEK